MSFKIDELFKTEEEFKEFVVNEVIEHIGEYALNVSINVEKLDSDADYEYIADRVGEVFQKKLQKNGFNTAAYSF